MTEDGGKESRICVQINEATLAPIPGIWKWLKVEFPMNVIYFNIRL